MQIELKQVIKHIIHISLLESNYLFYIKNINKDLVVMFAEDEIAKGQVVVKKMKDGQQSSENLSDLVSVVKSQLS